MKLKVLLILLMALGLSLNGQTVRLKAHLKDSAKKSVTLTGTGVSIQIKGSAKKIVLIVRNTGEEVLDLDPDKVKLLDAARRGEPLCGKSVTVRPGKKARWVLIPCDSDKGDGLFGLRYNQEAGFDKDVDASFIYDKEFNLFIDGQRLRFYTSW